MFTFEKTLRIQDIIALIVAVFAGIGLYFQNNALNQTEVELGEVSALVKRLGDNEKKLQAEVLERILDITALQDHSNIMFKLSRSALNDNERFVSDAISSLAISNVIIANYLSSVNSTTKFNPIWSDLLLNMNKDLFLSTTISSVHMEKMREIGKSFDIKRGEILDQYSHATAMELWEKENQNMKDELALIVTKMGDELAKPRKRYIKAKNKLMKLVYNSIVEQQNISEEQAIN